MSAKEKSTTKVVILASGGLDSTACIAYYQQQEHPIELVWVDYGQKAARMEQLAVKRIAKFYGVPLKTMSLKDVHWDTDNVDMEYLGRNAILTFLGAIVLTKTHGLVSMGIHAGTDYIDCSEAFQKQIGDLVQLLSHGLIEVDFPFGTWLKEDVAQFCIKYKVPINLTYSCLAGTNPPCGKCVSCLDRAKLNEILEMS